MRKNKGFTLIELLAVIVVLAVIALITVPLVLNLVNKAKEGAAEASAYAYVKEVETYIMLSEINPNLVKLENGKTYEVSRIKYEEIAFIDLFVDRVYAEEAQDIYLNDIVNIKGDKPTSGKVTINENEVSEAKFVVKGYNVSCDKEICNASGKSKVEEPEEPDEIITNSFIKIVYLDPTDLTKTCDQTNSISTTGTKTGCMKWYAYNDDGTNYTMILDHNTTPLVAWNSKGSNTEMNEVKTELDNLVSVSKWKVTPRLIETDELAKITGAKESLKWTSSKEYKAPSYTDANLIFDINMDTHISWYYLDGQGNTYSKGENGWQLISATTQGASKYAWLYDNTYGCTSYGCSIADDNKYEYGSAGSKNYTYGYWTSNGTIGETTSVWYVSRGGRLDIKSVTNTNNLGVRPVITISKDLIN